MKYSLYRRSPENFFLAIVFFVGAPCACNLSEPFCVTNWCYEGFTVTFVTLCVMKSLQWSLCCEECWGGSSNQQEAVEEGTEEVREEEENSEGGTCARGTVCQWKTSWYVSHRMRFILVHAAADFLGRYLNTLASHITSRSPHTFPPLAYMIRYILYLICPNPNIGFLLLELKTGTLVIGTPAMGNVHTN